MNFCKEVQKSWIFAEKFKNHQFLKNNSKIIFKERMKECKYLQKDWKTTNFLEKSLKVINFLRKVQKSSIFEKRKKSTNFAKKFKNHHSL